MTDFLMQYGLFLAKSITFFVFTVLTVLAVVIIAMRSKAHSQDGTFVIENINDRLDDITELLDSEMLSKKELKAKIKIRKKSKLEQENQKDLPKLFVLHFDGDIKASQVNELRETITAILNIASAQDEVLVILESGGGFVPHYGLAASQLARFRDRDIPLTIAIDKIAASGGYLMACVANKIICAPFAIVGSIGVVAIIPNFYELLKKHNIEIEQHTAGQYKRTLTMFGENNDEAREKFKEELTETHVHFKEFIEKYRPQVNIEQVATGEHWSGEKAMSLKLVDELKTSDDYILEKYSFYNMYKISFVIKVSLKDKLSSSISGAISGAIENIVLNIVNLKKLI